MKTWCCLGKWLFHMSNDFSIGTADIPLSPIHLVSQYFTSKEQFTWQIVNYNVPNRQELKMIPNHVSSLKVTLLITAPGLSVVKSYKVTFMHFRFSIVGNVWILHKIHVFIFIRIISLIIFLLCLGNDTENMRIENLFWLKKQSPQAWLTWYSILPRPDLENGNTVSMSCERVLVQWCTAV